MVRRDALQARDHPPINPSGAASLRRNTMANPVPSRAAMNPASDFK